MPILANGATICAVNGQRFGIERGADRHILSLLRDNRTSHISPAEHRVARLYADGKTAAEVAAELRLSPMTVRNHLTAIYAKLGIHSKVALAKWLAAQS